MNTPDDARPNILLISFDDAIAFHHYRTVFGATLQTPNFDRICAQSTSFRAAYAQAPVCGPSRASFMSGLSPHQSSVFHNDTKVYDRIAPRDMWPYLLRQSGYFCSSGGKVHHGYKPLPEEIHGQLYDDERKLFRRDWVISKKRAQVSLGGLGKGIGTTDPADDGLFYDHQSATSAIDFLQNHDGQQPFYREVGFYGPHGPFATPIRFKEMFPPESFTPPDAWFEPYDTNAYADRYMSENLKRFRGHWWRKTMRNYFSAIAHTDHHLGRVWDALKASPHADNTIVVVLADHGLHLGERNRFRKTTLWEQVANVPLVVHDPRAPERREVDDPVALLDVGPTILEAAGLAPQPACPGRSLRPYMEGAGDTDRAVATFHFGSAAIRKGHHRLIRYEDGSTQLYDLTDDPWQFRNLGQDDPDFTPMFDALEETCAAHGLHIPRRAAGPHLLDAFIAGRKSARAAQGGA